ncbi:MAG: MarR family winged helix-turn-helix transcriptional regulator [Rhodospirillales bacterium]|jgi:DNA-binding MarR family transcriptional regulator
MNQDQAKALYPLTVAVRSLFHKLGNAVTRLHDGVGVSGGMRAVLENVITKGPQTVPELARVRPVSRQHIQSHVNALLKENLVEYLDNPAHRRSKLVQATEKGREIFTDLREREAEALSRLSLDIPAEDLKAARTVLTVLIDRFQSHEWEEIVNNLSPKTEEI